MLRTYAPRLARDPHARGRGRASQPASAPPLRRRRSSATEQRVVRARRPAAPWTSDRRGSPPRVARARAARGSNSWRDLTSRYGLHRARPDHCRAPRRARGRTSAPPSLPRAIRWRRASGSRADRGDVRGRRAYRCSRYRGARPRGRPHRGAAELPRLALWARANPSALDRLRWTVDGFDVTARATHAGDRVVLDARSLGDGRAHRLGGGERAVSSAGRKTTGHVTVDTQPPDVRVASTTVQKGSPLRLSGRIEADATVAVEGKPLELQDGAFTITYVSVPSRRLALVAKDAFGNGDEARTADPPATGVQRALVRGKRIITRAVPGAAVRTMALPLGVPPRPASRAVRGRWEGETYRHDGVFLVRAGPAPSPFSRAWRRTVIPRIKTGPWHGGEPDFASGFWLDVLRRHPERRYVSDGDPSHIFFPRKLAPQLAPRLRSGRTRTSGRRSLTTRLLPPWRPSGSSSAVP